MTYKPKALVDFDGPIHAYRHGWMDGTAYDSPTPGARERLEDMVNLGWDVVIFSSRAAWQIEAWLEQNGFPAYRVTNIKEPALVLIDDRAIRWTDWDQAMDELVAFYPIKHPATEEREFKENTDG